MSIRNFLGGKQLLFLNDVALNRVQERDKLKGSQMPSNRFIDVRLMIEAITGCEF